jgi:hypothetical protein
MPEGDAGLYVHFFAKGKEIQQVSTGKSTYTDSGVSRRCADKKIRDRRTGPEEGF